MPKPTQYVKFEETGLSASRKTKIWLVKNAQSDFEIGRIRWFPNWRKYVFEPAPNCIFDPNCLGDIKDFLLKALEEHKEGAA